MKVTRRDPLPGETFFGGGRGILIPFNPHRLMQVPQAQKPQPEKGTTEPQQQGDKEGTDNGNR